ncbi:hypothetical protein AVEN_205719-1 [Araneus ventricosus]|uniref:Uncharacterized protein n=1 Tax=Araneus ventricosus TaxID=182803 RepID=A0A4Y2P1K5_ARAVE|nr:hypothetical protein AVEN_205719-1 [Araneus ventricosus]
MESEMATFPQPSLLSELNPNPAVTGHVTCKLVGRISAGYCSESGEKAVGRVVINQVLEVERRDERISIHIREMFLLEPQLGETGWTNLFQVYISKQASVYKSTQILRTLSGQRVNPFAKRFYFFNDTTTLVAITMNRGH